MVELAEAWIIMLSERSSRYDTKRLSPSALPQILHCRYGGLGTGIGGWRALAMTFALALALAQAVALALALAWAFRIRHWHWQRHWRSHLALASST